MFDLYLFQKLFSHVPCFKFVIPVYITTRFAYCSVPKAACTKWKQILLKSSEIPLYENEDIETIFPHWDHQFKRLSDLDTIKALQVYGMFFMTSFL